MNARWPTDAFEGASSAAGPHPARAGRFDLEFVRHGATTRIGRQYVSYPFHMTRPFRLDAAIPSLSTVYQQSCSGGAYRADDLGLSLTARPGAHAHVTTQAATIVHDCHGAPVRQHVAMTCEANSFLAYTPDPLILFPGAGVRASVEIRSADSAVILFIDGFDCFDPMEQDRSFDVLQSDVTVRTLGGDLLAADNYRLEGAWLRPPIPAMGRWRRCLNALIIGPVDAIPTIARLDAECADPALVAGFSRLPNKAGLAVRALANDAQPLRRFSTALFQAVTYAALGSVPERRPK